MPSLTAQQRQTAIDAIIHMEGTDGSNNQYGPTKPGWGGGNSALSYGQFQNDISQGENKYDVMSSSQALLEMLENYNDDRTLMKKKLLRMDQTQPGQKPYATKLLQPTKHITISYPQRSRPRKIFRSGKPRIAPTKTASSTS